MSWLETCVLLMVAMPALATVVLALAGWFGVRMSERTVSGIVAIAFLGSVSCGITTGVAMASTGATGICTVLGTWFSIGDYAFEWSLLADRLSLPFAVFSAMLAGLIGAFSRRYLHREPGYFRFYLLLALFGTGVEVVVLAGGLDQVFFGWELVGLTSALLIAFFHDRQKPVEHGLRAFVTYRMCDVGLLSALVWLHHGGGSSHFVAADGPWAGIKVVGEGGAWIGLLLLWASMGKSAQVPLGGWLPRAMEGPTPSSAIFYGAVSIHLGPYLLLRASPVLAEHPQVAWAILAVGAATALHASFVGRVQTDIKSALAYASATQVGLIFVEIGLGLQWIALVHICGHSAIRTLEILRSPNLLHDHHHLSNAVGHQMPRVPFHVERLLPRSSRPWLFRHALERGYFDALLHGIVRGFAAVARRLDRLDRRCVERVGRERRTTTSGRAS